jgi:hypothetical protein
MCLFKIIFKYAGVKILYRYALALIAGYKGRIKAGEFLNAKDFWISVKADGVAAAMTTSSSMPGKFLGIDEVLPLTDVFLVREKSKNQSYFLSGTVILSCLFSLSSDIVWCGDRSAEAKRF